MNNILVLGASGLLGQALIKHFSSIGKNVGALCRSNIEFKHPNVNTHVVDILNFEDLDKVVANYDVVINCTGQITKSTNVFLELNTTGIKNIIKSIKRHGNYLIHVSSLSVYGTSDYVNEECVVNPETVYGASKYFAEYLIQEALSSAMICRVCNFYGENQQKGIMKYILNTYDENRRELYFNNNGLLKRYYIYIDDFVHVIAQSLEKKLAGCYNVVGNDFLTIKELVSLTESVLDCNFLVEYSDAEPIENIAQVDDAKIKSEIMYGEKTIKKYLEKNYN